MKAYVGFLDDKNGLNNDEDWWCTRKTDFCKSRGMFCIQCENISFLYEFV